MTKFAQTFVLLSFLLILGKSTAEGEIPMIIAPAPEEDIPMIIAPAPEPIPEPIPPPQACEDILPLILIKCFANSQVSCIGCDRTCQQYRDNVQCRPGYVDFPKCFCQPGYFRLTEDPSSPCVRADECPKGTCGREEIKCKQKACGCNEVAKCSGCDDRCQPWYQPPCVERYSDEATCLCKDGYIRFADGSCRKREECQSFRDY